MSADLKADLDALRLEVESLRRERGYYCSALGGFLANEVEKIEFKREDLLKMVGQQEPIQEFLENLRSS